MKNFFKTNKQLVTVLVVVVVIILMCKRSNYRLSPSRLEIDGKKGPKNGIFGLPYSLKCVPGPQATAGYYTKDLTPGGICDAQKYVASQAGDYKILGGIGGSLLSPRQTEMLETDIVNGPQ